MNKKDVALFLWTIGVVMLAVAVALWHLIAMKDYFFMLLPIATLLLLVGVLTNGLWTLHKL